MIMVTVFLSNLMERDRVDSSYQIEWNMNVFTVHIATKIIFYSIWKEMEIHFSGCNFILLPASFPQDGKFIPAVQETGVSWHNGGKSGAPSLSPSIRQCCDGPRGFRRALNWVPLMPRGTRLSDSCTSDLGFFPIFCEADAATGKLLPLPAGAQPRHRWRNSAATA